MSTFAEETIATLEQLFLAVSQLSQISIRDILKPEVYFHYEKTLQEAYDALTKVEDALTGKLSTMMQVLLGSHAR